MRLTRHDQSSIFSPLIFYSVVSLILVGANNLGITNIFRFPFEIVIIAPKRILYAFKVNLYSNISLLSRSDNYEKISQYESLKRELEVLNVKIQFVLEENNSLKKQLEAPNPPGWDFLPAKVIGRNRYLIIDKGKKDGLLPGMAVVYQNIFLGKIHAVTAKTSQVMILTDPDFKTTVKTNSGTNGLLTGAFGNEIILSRVLQKDLLVDQDQVVTAGEEGNYPADLLIGSVTKINSEVSDIYKSAQIESLVDYNKLSQVFALISF